MTHFHISAKILKPVLTDLNKVVDKRPTHPICGHVLVETTDILKLTVVNLSGVLVEQTISNCLISQQGSFTVDMKELIQAVKVSTSESIEFKVFEDEVQLSLESATCTLGILSVDEFPRYTHEFDVKSIIKLNSQDLINALTYAIPSISTDQTKPGIFGLNFNISKDIITNYATDGHVLVKYQYTLEASEYDIDRLNFTIPNLFLKALQDLIKKQKDPITSLVIGEDKLYFLCGNIKFYFTHLNPSDFPSVEKVMPTSFETKFTAYINSLEALSGWIQTNRNEESRYLAFTGINEETFFVKSTKYRYESYIPISGDSVKDLAFGLDLGLLLQLISPFKKKRVTFKFNEPNKPIILEIEDNPEYLGLIMPVQIKD